jgi:Holliday junction resolvase RusA-like endonuclease
MAPSPQTLPALSPPSAGTSNDSSNALTPPPSFSAPSAITFDVIGMEAATQGSKRAMPNGIMLETNKRLRPWRSHITDAALATNYPLTTAPVSISITFRFLRPKTHYIKSGLSPKAPLHLTSKQKGDIDKLSRAVLDALTGTLLHDDSQVVQLSAHKRYTTPDERPGALITIIPLAAT